jgi:hypothetical protein
MLLSNIRIFSRKRAAAALGLFALSMPVYSQFFIVGGEKSLSRWSQITTSKYSIIYPKGLDSLGMKYAESFETYFRLLGASAGYYPNQLMNNSLPVVLHTRYPIGNGIAEVAPSRFEVFTIGDPYAWFTNYPFDKMIAIHEARHSAQLQFSRDGAWNWMTKVFGEGVSFYVSRYYANVSLLEGDAVVMETALTDGGRGRTANFLSYYRMALDRDDYRNWFRWRYGSQRLYTPDYYTIGYMTVAGTRYMSRKWDFTRNYLLNSTRFFSFHAFEKTLEQYTMSKINPSWIRIADTFRTIWAEDDKVRGPFQDVNRIVSDNSIFFPVYRSVVQTSDGRLMAVREALDEIMELVEILPDGTERHVRYFQTDSKLVYSPATDCIYWSEAIIDTRWGMYGDSRIRMLKVGTKSIKDLTAHGLFVSPAVSADGKTLAAVELLEDATSRIVILDMNDGHVVRSIRPHEGTTAREVAFLGDEVVFTALGDEGTGIYSTDFDKVRVLVEPAILLTRGLISHGDAVYFTTDRNGTDEIYSYSHAEGVKQQTNTKYGVSGAFFKDDRLCFTALQPDGKMPSTVQEPLDRSVDYGDRYKYPIADYLSEQEGRIPLPPILTEHGTPQKYTAMNGLKLHTWVPFYVNSDRVMAGSESYLPAETSSLGFTAYLQNLPTTLTGTLAFSVTSDPFASSKDQTPDYMPGLHFKMSYTGLYPVIDMAFDMGKRYSAETFRGFRTSDKDKSEKIVSQKSMDRGLFMGGRLTLSVPLNFSSGGWERSVMPFVGVQTSTDAVAGFYRDLDYNSNDGTFTPKKPVNSDLYPTTRIVAGLSGDISLNTAPSCIVPKWGIGGGVQYSMNSFSNSLYAMMYGYLPGLMSTHGVVLQAAMQKKHMNLISTKADVWAFDMYDMTPRGYYNTNAWALIKLDYLDTYRISADYVFPLFPLDLAIGQLFYLRNLEVNPFAEITFASKPDRSDHMLSTGVEVLFRFEKLLYLTQTSKVGFRYCYNRDSMGDLIDHSGQATIQFVSGITF